MIFCAHLNPTGPACQPLLFVTWLCVGEERDDVSGSWHCQTVVVLIIIIVKPLVAQ